MALIKLSNVSKIYKMGDSKVKALDDVSMEVHEGEYVSIMGPSGSGKSTMLNVIGCLDLPTSGDYELNGIAVKTLSDKKLAVARNQMIGFVFQHFYLLSNLTALENVELPMLYGGVDKKVRRERAENALEIVELYERKKHKPSQLSGGQQQRVAIARAIATNPKLILADEPTGALDSKTGVLIMELFEKMNKETGITIVQVTHDRNIALYGKKIYHMLDGKIQEVEVLKNEK